LQNGYYILRTCHGTCVEATPDFQVRAAPQTPSPSFTWFVAFNHGGVTFQSCNGRFLCADSMRAVADRMAAQEWEHWQPEFRGTRVRLRSHQRRYLCAEPNGSVVADRERAKDWEEFTLVPASGFQPMPAPAMPMPMPMPMPTYGITPGQYYLKSAAHGTFVEPQANFGLMATRSVTPAGVWTVQSTPQGVTFMSGFGRYLCADNLRAVADRTAAKEWEHWQPEFRGPRVCFRSHQGRYLCAEPAGRVVADRAQASEWEEFELVPAGTMMAPSIPPPAYYPMPVPQPVPVPVPVPMPMPMPMPPHHPHHQPGGRMGSCHETSCQYFMQQVALPHTHDVSCRDIHWPFFMKHGCPHHSFTSTQHQ